METTTMQLTSDEQNVLESLYGRQLDGLGGYNPRKLEAVCELSAQEKKFFADKNFMSPYFFVQTLYKIHGSISPIKFNIAVTRLIAENANLRVNFCDLGMRTVKVIRPAIAIKPEVIFRNLTQKNKDELDDDFRKIFEADMRREVDLRHDPLIRFAVYRTGHNDCAVFVTIAQLIADSFDAEKFFCTVLDIPFVSEPQKADDELPQKNHEAIRDYWLKILDKAPPPCTLPFERNDSAGAYRQRAYRTLIPADILSDLRGLAQNNRVMLTAILQSAWGFMLHLTNKRRDCLFCQILPAKKTDDDFSLHAVPVRLTGDDNSTVEQIVRKLFRQQVVSQPYSQIDWAELGELTGHKKLFNHFLSFKEFQSDGLKYADAPAATTGKIVYRNSWDAQGMEFGAYFRYFGKALAIGFLYDNKKFMPGGVERLCELYKFILQQMLVDWHALYPDFIDRLRNRLNTQIKDEEAASEEERRKRLRDMISQLPLLQGRFGGTIGLFERQANLVTLYEGDRISSDDMEKDFIFVADGILSRNVDTGDGWYNTLDIIEKNAFINPTFLLEKQLFKFSVTVLSDQAELLTVPHDVLIEVLRTNPEIALTVMNGAIAQMERYQFLWMQT